MKFLKSYNIETIIKSIRMIGKKRLLYLTCILVFCAVQLGGIPLRTYGIQGVFAAAGGKNPGLFLHSLFLLLLSNVLWWLVAPISTYLCALSSREAMSRIKTDLFEHMVKFPQQVLDGRPKGEWFSALSNDTACLQEIYDGGFWNVLNNALNGIGGLTMMAVIDWRFAIVVFALGSASVFASAWFSKKLEKSGQDVQERLAKSSSDAYELIRSAKTIRLLKLIPYKTRQFADSTSQEANIKIAGGRISTEMNTIVIGIQLLSYLAILGAGALFVYYRLSDWGTVVALTSLKDLADDLFIKSGRAMAELQKNIAGVRRILAVFQMEEEAESAERFFRFKEEGAAAELHNLRFAYPGSEPVLTDFSLSVVSRQLTALTGKSGSGKSTVVRLILGLYHPEGGEIVFRGKGAPTIASLRKQTAYVPQEPMLFRGSIFENIACGKDGCSREEVKAAAKLAEADNFISIMENGYDTLLTDGGNNLSGGQRQRIALARALVKGAPILLLDEITSSLDAQTERQILQTVRQISREKAVLLVTHKPDIEALADITCPIEDGSIFRQPVHP